MQGFINAGIEFEVKRVWPPISGYTFKDMPPVVGDSCLGDYLFNSNLQGPTRRKYV